MLMRRSVIRVGVSYAQLSLLSSALAALIGYPVVWTMFLVVCWLRTGDRLGIPGAGSGTKHSGLVGGGWP